jgi:hypothetical protein
MQECSERGIVEVFLGKESSPHLIISIEIKLSLSIKLNYTIQSKAKKIIDSSVDKGATVQHA